jgi:hypothetical protein
MSCACCERRSQGTSLARFPRPTVIALLLRDTSWLLDQNQETKRHAL